MPISTHKSKSNPWTWSTSPSKRCFVSTLPPIVSWGISTATGVSQFLTQEHATRRREPRVLLAGALVGAAVPSRGFLCRRLKSGGFETERFWNDLRAQRTMQLHFFDTSHFHTTLYGQWSD